MKLRVFFLFFIIIILYSCVGNILLYEYKGNCIYKYNVFYNNDQQRIIMIFDNPVKLDINSIFFCHKEIENIIVEDDLTYSLFFYDSYGSQEQIKRITEECIKEIDKIIKTKCIIP